MGPFRADLSDERTGIVVDIDAPNRPVNRYVKHRILESLGFKPVSISYWRWRQCKSDEDQMDFLDRLMTGLLIAPEEGE